MKITIRISRFANQLELELAKTKCQLIRVRISIFANRLASSRLKMNKHAECLGQRSQTHIHTHTHTHTLDLLLHPDH